MNEIIKTLITDANLPIVILYFLSASITTYDIRITQGKKDGSIPLHQQDLPSWVGLLHFVQIGILIYFAITINWKVAVLLFGIKFTLKVLPVLETIGALIMSLFIEQKR